MNKPINTFRVIPTLVLLALGLSAHAATLWWDGNASIVNSASDNTGTGTINWFSGGNWDNGTTSATIVAGGWTGGNSAIFGGSTAGQTITAGTLTIGNMTFGGGGDGSGTSGTAYTITGGAITLSGGSIITNNTTTTINTAMSGAGGSLTKWGAATLTLGGTSTYTGGTTVNNGALTLANGVANGIIRGSLTINSAGTVNPTTTWSLGQGNGGVTNIVINGGTLNFTGTPDNGGTATRTITMTGGTISGSHWDWYNGITSTPTLTTLASSSTATISSGFRLRLANNKITMDVAQGTTASGIDLLVSGALTSNASDGVNKTGAGLLNLAAANTYPGATIVNAGTLWVNGSTAATSAMTVTNATLAGSGTISGSVTLQKDATLGAGTNNIGVLTIANTLTLNSGSTNFMRLTKTGGTATNDLVKGLTGTLTYAGTLVVSDVTSDLTPLANNDKFILFTKAAGGYAGGFSSFVLPTLPTGLSWDKSGLTIDGSIKVVNNVGTPAITPASGGYVGAQSVSINSDAGATIFYTTNGTAPTTSSASGISPLNNVFTIPANAVMTVIAYATNSAQTDSPLVTNVITTVSTPTWLNTAGGSWPTAANWSNNVVAPSASDAIADFSVLNLPANVTNTLDGARTVGSMYFDDQNSTKHTWTLSTGSGDPLTLAVSSGSPIISNNVPTTISANIAGTQGLTKSGTGTLTNSGTCNYTGMTTVNEGTLVFSTTADDRFSGSAGNIQIASGATFQLDTPSGNPRFNRSGLNYTGAGTFLKTGNSTVYLSYGTTHEAFNMSAGGLINVSVGTLSDFNTATGNLGDLNVASGATVQNAFGSMYFNSLTGAGTVTELNLAPYTWTFGVNGGSGTFSGVIAGGSKIAITKTGTGTQTLSGNNTYTGATTVSNGTLRVDGSLASGSVVTVAGGTLSGTGTIGGTVNVLSGGALAPGASIGTLNTANVTLNSGSTTAIEINKSGSTLTQDQLNSSGTVTLGGKLRITRAGDALAANDEFDILTGTLAGAYTGLELVGWGDTALRVDLTQVKAGGTGVIKITANTAPTAAGFALVTEKNTATAADLAKYASDPDGDFLGVSFSAPAHGSVALLNGQITYTPTTAYVGSDSFTYTVSDPSGAAAAATTVNVTVNPVASGLNILSLQPGVPASGQATLTYAGMPGQTYDLERYTDAQPVWTVIANSTAPAGGVTTVVDTAAPPSGTVLYRLKRN